MCSLCLASSLFQCIDGLESAVDGRRNEFIRHCPFEESLDSVDPVVDEATDQTALGLSPLMLLLPIGGSRFHHLQSDRLQCQWAEFRRDCVTVQFFQRSSDNRKASTSEVGVSSGCR